MGCISTTAERQLNRRVKFQDAYGELLPFATEWKSIGLLMDVPLSTIRKIAEKQEESCISLAEVLESGNFAPTRKKFNEVLEKIKAAKAEMAQYY